MSILSVSLAIGAASIAWFVTAGASFFNPVVDEIYRSEESHAAVRALPQGPKTIGMILAAVLLQTVLWAGVFAWIRPALGDDPLTQGLVFGGILSLTKIVPRDVDRLLLTTYPPKRMTIEFVVGVLCAFVVGLVFAYVL